MIPAQPIDLTEARVCDTNLAHRSDGGPGL